MRCAWAITSQKGWVEMRRAAPAGLKTRNYALIAAVLVALAPAAGRSEDHPLHSAAGAPLAQEVATVGMTVADMDRSLAFFTNVLTFEKVSDVELAGGEHERLQGLFGVRMRVVRLRLGAEQIELTEFLAPRGRPVPVDSRSNDGWFQHVAIIVSDMDAAYARLRQHRVEHASPEPQRLPDWNPNAGGIEAFYFKDPDGHPLEILRFPAGKGEVRWQATTRLFLGIDHTAIVVGDTSASLRFYRDTLGLRVAGESTNYGPEQERLNNVFGARLHITALRAAKGPGIEFLEYLSPRNGRPAAGIQPNDLAHWETTITTADENRALERFLMQRVMLVSPSVAVLGRPSEFAKGLLVRDPDGHAVKVVQR
jgi:catechol 2,3-dioxygenase-like lactoylglutathione lyase family enzyme